MITSLILVEVAGRNVVHNNCFFSEGIGAIDGDVVLGQVGGIAVLKLTNNFYLVLIAAMPSNLIDRMFILLFDHYTFLKHVLC